MLKTHHTRKILIADGTKLIILFWTCNTREATVSQQLHLSPSCAKWWFYSDAGNLSTSPNHLFFHTVLFFSALQSGNLPWLNFDETRLNKFTLQRKNNTDTASHPLHPLCHAQAKWSYTPCWFHAQTSGSWSEPLRLHGSACFGGENILKNL